MDRSRPDQIIEAWASVASSAVRPATPPRRTVVRSSLPGLSLAGAALLVGALVLGVMWLGGPGSDPGVGGVTSPDPTPTPSATAEPTAPPSATPAPTPSMVLESSTPFGTCSIEELTARITAWEGAAGSRIATVEMSYAGADACFVPTLAKVQLQDATPSILIDGETPVDSENLRLAPGDRVTTLVMASNYCGPEPIAPVGLNFWTPQGSIVIAAPLSPTDATVPPCNGPGQPATIEMQPWTN